MVFVHPREIQRYCLRLLLTHIAGACGYEDLRTVGQEVHPTFRAAAIARGLMEGDAEQEACLAEARTMASASMLRNLFV